MGLIDTVKGKIGQMKRNSDAKKYNAERLEISSAKKNIALRKKWIPVIEKIARGEFHARFEAFDTHATVFKTVNGREREVDIPYGTRPDVIRLRLEKGLMAESSIDKFARKAKATGEALKVVKKGLGDVSKELKSKGGGMYSDPNFGKGMIASRSTPKKKRSSSSSSPSYGVDTSGYGGSNGGESEGAKKLRRMYGM